MIYKGQVDAEEVYLGAVQIDEAYFRGFKVWPESEFIPSIMELTWKLSPGRTANTLQLFADDVSVKSEVLANIDKITVNGKNVPIDTYYTLSESEHDIETFIVQYRLTKPEIPVRMFYRVGQNLQLHPFKLIGLIIPSGVKTIGDYSFCSVYTVDGPSLSVPSSVETIGELAFFGMSFSGFQLNNGICIIKKRAFTSCMLKGSAEFTTITIPSTVSLIETSAFKNFQFVNEVIFQEGLTELGYQSLAGMDWTSDPYVDMVLPASLRTIGDQVFGSYWESTPSGLQRVTNLTFLSPTPPSLLTPYLFSSTLTGKVNFPNTTIYVPAGSLEAYKTAVNWSYWADCIEAIPE